MNNPLADTDARPRPAVRLEHVTKDFGAASSASTTSPRSSAPVPSPCCSACPARASQPCSGTSMDCIARHPAPSRSSARTWRPCGAGPCGHFDVRSRDIPAFQPNWSDVRARERVHRPTRIARRSPAVADDVSRERATGGTREAGPRGSRRPGYQRADTLSGGQQQRVAIARALMQHPKVLLADEPVASLDPVSAREVMGLLQEISSENQLTVIASLHQVQLAIDFADRIVGLRSGRIVLDQTTGGLHAEEASQIYTSVSGMALAGMVVGSEHDRYPEIPRRIPSETRPASRVRCGRAGHDRPRGRRCLVGRFARNQPRDHCQITGQRCRLHPADVPPRLPAGGRDGESDLRDPGHRVPGHVPGRSVVRPTGSGCREGHHEGRLSQALPAR